MRSKSLSQQFAGFSRCQSYDAHVMSNGRKALTAGAAVLAALFSVTAANAQGLIRFR